MALGKKDLEVQTKTSSAIFVEPVERAKRSVYLDVRSGVMEFDRNAFKQFVVQQFAQNGEGYRIVDSPDQANFQMLAYVLNLEKANLSAAQSALQQGYVGGGEAVAGAAVGAVVGRQSGNTWQGGLIGGVVGAGAALVGNALVKDVTYMLVCDVSIRERLQNGALVRRDTKIDTKVSDAGSSQQRVSEVSDRKEYRTRIVTTANKANLTLDEAEDEMFRKTAYAMAGFF
ncbi:MAG: complement resistance protein TraT [Oceanococcus sp.]